MSFSLARALPVALVLAATACSSDSESDSDDDDGSKACVKVQHYTADNQRDGEPSACLDYPAECAGAEDACGEPGGACSEALSALCKQGTKRNVCVGVSLNDVVQSVDLGCQVEKPLD